MAAKTKSKVSPKTAAATPSGKAVLASMQAMAKQMNAKVVSSLSSKGKCK